MAMLPLHLPTLFVVSAAVIAFSGMILLLARGRDHDSPALAFWGAAIMVGAAGLVLLTTAPTPGSVAGIGGTAAILLGTGLSWSGARVFAGRRVAVAVVLAGPLCWLLGSTLPLEAAQPSNSILGLAIGSAYILATASELWEGRGEPLPSRRAAITLLLLHAGIYLGRAASLCLAPQDGWTSNATIVEAMMLETLFHTVGMAFLMVLLMKERAELRSRIQLEELAMVDGLTGLGNRRQFDQALDREFKRAVRDHKPLALLMIDADHFKAYNDTYGHQAGDDCLCAIASAIQSAMRRPGDIEARYGGEEFAVLMPNTDEAGAVAVAEAIQINLATSRIKHAGSPHQQVAVSIGVAVFLPPGANNASQLVRAADRALYGAKRAGRNRIQTADEFAWQAQGPVLTLAVTNTTPRPSGHTIKSVAEGAYARAFWPPRS